MGQFENPSRLSPIRLLPIGWMPAFASMTALKSGGLSFPRKRESSRRQQGLPRRWPVVRKIDLKLTHCLRHCESVSCPSPLLGRFHHRKIDPNRLLSACIRSKALLGIAFIGMLRVPLFLAYAPATVKVFRFKSISSQRRVRASNSIRSPSRMPRRVMLRNGSAAAASKRASSS